MIRQKTIRRSASIEGVGLHSGKTVRLTIHPAPAGRGIQFVRSDRPDAEPLPADVKHVVGTAFATTLGHDDFTVATVEHLMSALAGLGVDNATVELDADEVPILDGSAAPFAKLVREAGRRELAAARKYLVIDSPISVADGDKRATLYPSREFRVSYTIEFDHPVIRMQQFKLALQDGQYEREIAPARTFGFLHEVNMLKANGFAAGGSLDNAVVVGASSVLNSEGLRFPDEFVRHKVLDSIGDLYLLGMPILGHLVARKSGHDLNTRLSREVLLRPERWHVTELAKSGERAVEPAFALETAVAAAR